MIRSVSILIPTHNRADLLKRTLESLAALELKPSVEVDLLVVANACTDSTIVDCRSAFAALPMPARYVEEPVPGLSVARNRAIAETRGDICAFLDDDVRVSPQWLEAMLEVYNSYPADIVGGKVDLWWEAVQRPDWFAEELDSYLSSLNHGDRVIELASPRSIVGANFALKRSIFAPTGPFRTDLGRIGADLLSNEDTEFCQRARQQGARVFYSPDMQLMHWVAPQRVTVDYLVGVARGFGKGRIRAKQTFGPALFFRSFFGNIYRVLRYGSERLAAKLNGNRRQAVTSLVRQADAESALVESVSRALSVGK